MNDKNYVLLIEDNPNEVALTERAFRKTKISNKLVAVYDGQEALDFLFGQGRYAGRDINDKPALILLDLNLPLVTGLEVLKTIRSSKSTCKISVIVLTSSLENKDLVESNRLGADDYICKPTSFSEFVEIIQAIKSRWLDSNGSNPVS